MKAIKNFFCLFIFTISLISFVSCSKDKDDNDNGNGNNNGNTELPAGWTEDGNKLIYKTIQDTGGYEFVYVWTMTFDGDVCIKARLEITCPNAAMAQIIYDGFEAEEKEISSVSGRVITMNLDEDYYGLSKQDIKDAITAGGGWI